MRLSASSHYRASLVCTVVLAGIAVSAGCLTDPPPDLPTLSEPPTIVHVSVWPTEGVPLTTWPPYFSVPIRVLDPTQPCSYSVFDYDTFGRDTPVPGYSCKQCPAVVDAGQVQIEFTFAAGQIDPSQCHEIHFTVGSTVSSANNPACRVGNDTVWWFYRPAFGSCVTYDAGALDDGAFPDAASDGLPVVPESGVDP